MMGVKHVLYGLQRVGRRCRQLARRLLFRRRRLSER